MPDYSQEERPDRERNILTELEDLARQLAHAEREVDQRKLDLARAEARARDLREVIIPEAMGTVKHFETVDGLEISIDDDVYASISKDNERAAHSWLDENGHGGMIKRRVMVEFDRDQEEQVVELIRTLRTEYPQTKEERKIEWSTLRAWVKRRLKEGEPTPEELFGIHVRPVAKLKRKKP